MSIDEERAVYLCDYNNVVRDLANTSPDEWVLVRAAMLHITHSEDLRSEHNRWLGQQILGSFEKEPLNHLYDLVLETRRDRPEPRVDPQEMFTNHRMTAREATYYYSRAAANGRRAHQRCKVLGCPCRMDFSRAEAALMASSGRATSISFLRVALMFISGPIQWAIGSQRDSRQSGR